MSCFEILWETVKIVIGFDNNRDFVDVLISRMFLYQEFFARARARASARTNKKRARARARAREIEEKNQYFSDFTRGKTN